MLTVDLIDQAMNRLVVHDLSDLPEEQQQEESRKFNQHLSVIRNMFIQSVRTYVNTWRMDLGTIEDFRKFLNLFSDYLSVLNTVVNEQ